MYIVKDARIKHKQTVYSPKIQYELKVTNKGKGNNIEL